MGVIRCGKNGEYEDEFKGDWQWLRVLKKGKKEQKGFPPADTAATARDLQRILRAYALKLIDDALSNHTCPKGCNRRFVDLLADIDLDVRPGNTNFSCWDYDIEVEWTAWIFCLGEDEFISPEKEREFCGEQDLEKWGSGTARGEGDDCAEACAEARLEAWRKIDKGGRLPDCPRKCPVRHVVYWLGACECDAGKAGAQAKVPWRVQVFCMPEGKKLVRARRF